MAEVYEAIIMGEDPQGVQRIYSPRSGLKTLVVDKGPTSGSLGASRRWRNAGQPSPVSSPQAISSAGV